MSMYTGPQGKVDAFQWTGCPDQLEDPFWMVDAIKRGLVKVKNSGTPEVQLVACMWGQELFTINQGQYISYHGDTIMVYKKDYFETNYSKIS